MNSDKRYMRFSCKRADALGSQIQGPLNGEFQTGGVPDLDSSVPVCPFFFFCDFLDFSGFSGFVWGVSIQIQIWEIQRGLGKRGLGPKGANWAEKGPFRGNF